MTEEEKTEYDEEANAWLANQAAKEEADMTAAGYADMTNVEKTIY